jgi:hypothetical protein
MKIIPEHKVRAMIQEDMNELGFCAQQKEVIHVDGIVAEVMTAQEGQIRFAENNIETSPTLYSQTRLESSVIFKIRKMIESDLRKHFSVTTTAAA